MQTALAEKGGLYTKFLLGSKCINIKHHRCNVKLNVATHNRKEPMHNKLSELANMMHLKCTNALSHTRSLNIQLKHKHYIFFKTSYVNEYKMCYLRNNRRIRPNYDTIRNSRVTPNPQRRSI